MKHILILNLILFSGANHLFSQDASLIYKNTCPPFGVKSKPFILLAIAMIVSTMSFAQSIHFNYTDGTNASYNLEDVRKITFDADVMNLYLLDGSVYAWNVSTIGDYQYDETLVNVQEWLNNANAWEMAVYPNPTNSMLNIRFQLPKEDNISIALIDIQGKLLLYKNLGNKAVGEHQETFDLNGIPQGTYICLISGQKNTITKQLIKQ